MHMQLWETIQRDPMFFYSTALILQNYSMISPIQLGINLHTFRRQNSYKRTFKNSILQNSIICKSQWPFQQKNEPGGPLGCYDPRGNPPTEGLVGVPGPDLQHVNEGPLLSFSPIILWKDVGRRRKVGAGGKDIHTLWTNGGPGSKQRPALVLASPALISCIVFLVIRLGSWAQCCPVWWSLSIGSCWALETWLVWVFNVN